NHKASRFVFCASRFFYRRSVRAKPIPGILMQAILIIVHLFVAVALIFVVLLQRSEGGALGMGGGGSGLGGLFSPRGAASTLTRTTAVLAIMFFLTSLILTLLSLHGRPQSFLETNPGAPVRTLPIQKSPPKPVAPAVPS